MTKPIPLTMTFSVFPSILVCFITDDWTVPFNHEIDYGFFNYDFFCSNNDITVKTLYTL